MKELARTPESGQPGRGQVVAAIDVGTNATRLILARVGPDHTYEILHQERAPIRPGEGVFMSGLIRREVADRLVETLSRYGALVRRYDAQLRAVATSAMRDAKNRTDVVRRVREEAGVQLEVISGQEEARLISLGILSGVPPRPRSLCVDIGGGSTELIIAEHKRPVHLWSLDLGAVRLTEIFRADQAISKKELKVMRAFAREVIADAGIRARLGRISYALGSSGTIGAVVDFARKKKGDSATREEISRAVEVIAAMSPAKRRKQFDANRGDVIVGGAVVLEAVLEELGLAGIQPTSRGLRDGLLVDLVQRRPGDEDSSAEGGALALGRRVGFGEAHATQVASLVRPLFERFSANGELPRSAGVLLHTAALLHDIGYVVSAVRHHKHSHYLITHAELPGLSERQQLLVAIIARFHRRSPPEPQHELLRSLDENEVQIVRRCTALLRMADALDRSHQQPVRKLSAVLRPGKLCLHLQVNAPIELELWDLARKASLFTEVFERKLEVRVRREPSAKRRSLKRRTGARKTAPRASGQRTSKQRTRRR